MKERQKDDGDENEDGEEEKAEERSNGGGKREERGGRSEEGMRTTVRPDRTVQLNRPWVVREGPRQVRQTSKRP